MNMFKKLVLSVVLSSVIIAGCAQTGAGASTNIVLLTGQFSEIDILMHMAALLIEEHTDLNIVLHDSMNTVAAANTLVAGGVDLFVGYDGTMLTTLLGYDPSDVPPGELLFDFANQRGSEERGLMLLGKFGFENTYALAIRQEFAEENDIQTISDLVPFATNMVFGAEHEFFDAEGTMRFVPFNAHYGFEWQDDLSMEMALKFAAIESGQIDATMVYSTDGLNLRFGLAVLEDDLAFFPEYHASFQMRTTLFEEFAEAAPNLEEVLSLLTGRIDNYTMIRLNYAVDGEGRTPQAVAREFLESIGLL